MTTPPSPTFTKRFFKSGALCLSSIALALAMGSCADEQPTALVVAISSEAKVPVEVDRMDLTITRGGSQKYHREYNLRKGDRLPGTLTLSRGDDSSAVVDITVRARLENGESKKTWRVVRRAILGFSDEKTKLLRMPLRYSCFDFPEICKDNETCIGGVCKSAVVNVEELPEFETNDQVVKELDPTKAPKEGSDECFVPEVCLAAAVPFAHVKGECSYPVNFDSGHGNLAMRWAATPGRLVVLDQDPEEGYTIKDKVATLSAGLCLALDDGRALQVLADGTCKTKTPAQPICSPPPPPPGSDLAECEPKPETCNGADDDCDGVIDNDLTDSFQSCVAIASGACAAGRTVCQNGVFTCESELPPQPEICNNGIDEDCDGTPDQGCICNDDETRECYTGAEGTQNIGPCKAGTQKCTNQMWGDCEGQVLPSEETCDGVFDANCTGDNEIKCDCSAGATEDCYTGSAEKAGIGKCTMGTRSCTNGSWGSCEGSILPDDTETCENQTDDNCDGNIDEGCSCKDGDTQPCFDGPTEARGKGICQDGQQTCASSAWGTCEGSILPNDTEICDNQLDDNCNGDVDEDCPCNEGDTQVCYQGPETTRNVGICIDGVQTCTGGVWSGCDGQVLPTDEVCEGAADENCDGQVDEECMVTQCNMGDSRECYSGAPGTEEVSPCQKGTQSCDGNAWGPCTGDVTPQNEICGDGIDQNCDGVPDDGCGCEPNAMQECYSGPQGTQNNGPCHAGTQTCDADGNWGVCENEVTPTAEDCSMPLSDTIDADCDGTPATADSDCQ